MGLFSGSSKSESTQTTTPMRPRQVRDWQDRFFALSRMPREFFPGQTYAAMDPLQQEALTGRETYARGLSAMTDPAMRAWQTTMSAPDVANNPYVQNMLNQQAEIASRNLRESIPGIESAAIGAGQFGSSRQGVVEALRERGIREALAQSAAATQLGAYEQGLAQQRYGLSAAPGMAQFGMAPMDVLSGVGATRRAEEQRAIDEAMARHQYAQEEEFERLARFVSPYMAMSGPYGTTTSKSKSSVTPSALQIGTQLAGLGMAGMGMFGGRKSPFGSMPAYDAFTGQTYGTNPYSQQSAMLAQQMDWF